MEETIADPRSSFLITLGTFFTVLVIYYTVRFFLNLQGKGKQDWSLIRSSILFAVMLIGGIAVILALPMTDELRGQVTSLIGIVISAVLALSSATIIGNGLAGIMLRAIRSFKPGDFIKVNDHFGRITERSLFHTEIQTEDRDLTTLPNLYLATNPIKVTRSSGTLISGTVSLGYDVNRQKIENTLLEAAKMAELKDSFVRITELGDFSVVYKIYGLLENIKTVISSQSKLNACIIDALHDADIEIVSPTFMNQRPVGDTIFIPKKVRKHEEVKPAAEAPENLIFDKAEDAESLENRKEKLADIEEKLKVLQEELKAAEDDKKEGIKARIEKWTQVKDKMIEKIDTKIDEINSKK